MTKIFYLDVSALADEPLFENAIKLLSPQRKEKLDRIKNIIDKKLSIGAWLCLREALKSFPALSEDMEITTDKNGKPHFKNCEYLHFSLSHSGKMALCALSDKEIGADIQLMGDFNEKICKKYFSHSEAQYVFSASTKEEKEKRFFRIWSLKEAYVKMTGEGLFGFKKFSLLEDNKAFISLPENASFAEFDTDGYKIAVCTKEKETDFEFKKLNLYKMLIK